VALNNSRILALLTLTTLAACGDSPLSENLDAATTFGPDGGSSGPVAWPGETSIDGGPWVPSQTCWERAAALVELLTPAQCFGQMTTVDSSGLTVAEATSALLGSVFSGGGSDPTTPGGVTSNLIPDWLAMISSYLDVAKGSTPYIGLLYGLDSVHGNNNVQDAVMFPHSIGIGASRNLALAEQVGRITALEMLGVGANWTFAPTVAPALDQRWGRTYETFGEKAELTAPFGAALVKGFQNGKLGSPPSVLA